ncbi:MAG: hypothetical protein KTR31_37910 [Myxococcales bacterium]|nr:hypothetical protein [Myxococcales bacterium]
MSVPDLDSDLRALLDAESAVPIPDLAVRRDRVWRRTRQALELDGPDGAESGGNADAAPPRESGTGPGWAAVVGAGVGGLLAGVGVGVWLGASEPVAPVVIEVPVPVRVAPAPEPPPVVSPPPPRPVPAPAPPAPPTRAPEPTPFSEEEGIIDRARVSLRRDDAQEALVTLMGHARRYPAGELIEERERLIIEALAELGRFAEAQERAMAFRVRYPNSVHLPFVEPYLPIELDDD